MPGVLQTCHRASCRSSFKPVLHNWCLMHLLVSLIILVIDKLRFYMTRRTEAKWYCTFEIPGNLPVNAVYSNDFSNSFIWLVSWFRTCHLNSTPHWKPMRVLCNDFPLFDILPVRPECNHRFTWEYPSSWGAADDCRKSLQRNRLKEARKNTISSVGYDDYYSRQNWTVIRILL